MNIASSLSKKLINLQSHFAHHFLVSVTGNSFVSKYYGICLKLNLQPNMLQKITKYEALADFEVYLMPSAGIV